jgi:hypothetical protein
MRKLLLILIALTGVAIIAVPSYLVGFNLGRTHLAPEKENNLRLEIQDEILQRLENTPVSPVQQTDQGIVNGTIKEIRESSLVVMRTAATYADVVKEPEKEIVLTVTPDTKIYFQTIEPAAETGKPSKPVDHIISLKDLVEGETIVAELDAEQSAPKSPVAKLIIVNER